MVTGGVDTLVQSLSAVQIAGQHTGPDAQANNTGTSVTDNAVIQGENQDSASFARAGNDPFITSASSDATVVSPGKTISPAESEGTLAVVSPDKGKARAVEYAVRNDRANVVPSNNTAQAHFGPECCVFVAK